MVVLCTHCTSIPIMGYHVYTQLHSDPADEVSGSIDQLTGDMLLPLYCFVLMSVLCRHLREHLLCGFCLACCILLSLWPTLDAAVLTEVLSLLSISVVLRGACALYEEKFPMPEGGRFVVGAALASALLIVNVIQQSRYRLVEMLNISGMLMHDGQSPDFFSWILHALPVSLVVVTAGGVQWRLAPPAE